MQVNFHTIITLTRNPMAKQKQFKLNRSEMTNVTGYFPPEVRSSIHLVLAQKGGTLQGLLGEALYDIFEKYKVKQTLPKP